ncbi:MAG: hypothetical protein ACO1NZ_16205 [Adhaeribacter sp.]
MIEKDDKAAGFLSDPHFREWVLRPDAQNSLFWDNYLTAHPGEREAMAWARHVIAALQQPVHTLAEEKADRLWAAIEAGMDSPRTMQGGAA